MKRRELKEFIEEPWCRCPICGYDCEIYYKGKNKGYYRCFECNIRFKKGKIINNLR